MNKYKSILIKKIKEDKNEKTEGKKIDEDTIVIEKDNNISLLLKFSMGILRLSVEFLVLFLAFLGLISLIYPELRHSLFLILSKVYREFLLLIK